MRFWDSSAILPLFITEPRSGTVRALFADDAEILVWGLTLVELESAIWRRAPQQHDDRQRRAVIQVVDEAQKTWSKIVTYTDVIRMTPAICERHRLRAGDALQLAAALYATAVPAVRPFVTLDTDLASAARAEGFPVLP